MFELVIDAFDPPRLARFWASALLDYSVRHYDDAEITRLADLGLTPETDPTVALDGPGPTIWFQKSGTKSEGRNRLHLDLCNKPRSTEIARLTALGASLLTERDDHAVMLDPEGNQFCLFDPKPS